MGLFGDIRYEIGQSRKSLKEGKKFRAEYKAMTPKQKERVWADARREENDFAIKQTNKAKSDAKEIRDPKKRAKELKKINNHLEFLKREEAAMKKATTKKRKAAPKKKATTTKKKTSSRPKKRTSSKRR